MRIDVAMEDSKSYEIIFINQRRHTSAEVIGNWLSSHPKCTQIVFITDTYIASVQETFINQMLQDIASLSRANVTKITVPEGELSKSVNSSEQIWNQLSEIGFTRNDLLIAFGGGMIGDLVGFCAATYLRGVAFIQIPTTLLAQIDSSVGGKVAINLPSGKNLVGQFYNPEFVIIDSKFLQTLDLNVLQDGLGELIKYAFMGDSELLSWLLRQESLMDIQRIIIEKPSEMDFVIQRCLAIKKAVVEKDFKEVHERKWLNLGHTFGHAIEQAESYRLGHGYSVVLGLYLAGEIGWRLLMAEAVAHGCEEASFSGSEREGYNRFKQLLVSCMTRFEFEWQLSVAFKDLVPFLMQDKKRVAHEVYMILPRFEQWVTPMDVEGTELCGEQLLNRLDAHLEIRSVALDFIEREMMRFEG